MDTPSGTKKIKRKKQTKDHPDVTEKKVLGLKDQKTTWGPKGQ